MSEDPIPLKAIHHVELWVGNAKQAAYYYRHAFGFSQVAYSGLETGVRDRASYVLGQGRIRLVLSTPLSGDNGMTTQFEVLQSQQTGAQARLHFAEAVVSYNRSQVYLLASLGLLGPDQLTPGPT